MVIRSVWIVWATFDFIVSQWGAWPKMILIFMCFLKIVVNFTLIWFIPLFKFFCHEEILFSLCIGALRGLILLIWPFSDCGFYIGWPSCSVDSWPFFRKLWSAFFSRQFKIRRGGLRWIARKWGSLGHSRRQRHCFVFLLICGCEKLIFNWCCWVRGVWNPDCW